MNPYRGGAWLAILNADHLDATELDRWVGPRSRPGWLERLLPSLLGGKAKAASGSELVRSLNVAGELRVDEFTIEKLKLQQVHLQGSLHDLQLDVPDGQAQWAGGSGARQHDGEIPAAAALRRGSAAGWRGFNATAHCGFRCQPAGWSGVGNFAFENRRRRPRRVAAEIKRERRRACCQPGISRLGCECQCGGRRSPRGRVALEHRATETSVSAIAAWRWKMCGWMAARSSH